MAVPTIDGNTVKIMNPRLDLCRMFSDNADLLVLYVNRLDLEGTLGSKLVALVKELTDREPKRAVVSEPAEPTPVGTPTPKLWELYAAAKWLDVVDKVSPASSQNDKKVLALSLMRLGRIYEAIKTSARTRK